MSRQEQVYAGPVLVDGDQFYAEVWVQDSTAVVFSRPDNAIRLTLHTVVLHNAENGQLIVYGIDEDGQSRTVQAIAAEQTLGSLMGATVAWPNEGAWMGASVTWTQYRVIVSLVGQEERVYAGASVRAYPREAYIVLPDSSEVHVSLPTRSGCCGGRR